MIALSSWAILGAGVLWAVIAAWVFCLMAVAGRRTPPPPTRPKLRTIAVETRDGVGYVRVRPECDRRRLS